MELFEFQRTAADQIADRYSAYWDDPAIVGRKANLRALPFYQSLASITASGKTVILAAAVAEIAARLELKPIVLWISRGKVVVEQSFNNLAAGGRYNDLLGPAEVRHLAEYDQADARDNETSQIYFATVGTFNQRDKESGSRLIYRCDIDTADQSTWDALKHRQTSSGDFRPLIVVYDEAHNLSDQQTELLLELEPQALLMASATMRLPGRLANEIVELKRQTDLNDADLITNVDPTAVADAGLVKSTVVLAGYNSPMEETIDVLLKNMTDAELDARAYGLPAPPKAIYVCQTNVVQANSFQSDDPKQPFQQRQASPILIWRYLVEQHQVDPATIAVYCSLKVDKNYPLPNSFVLFNGGDKDYADFANGEYRHVIFNLGLQEGWDDPSAYFAYVDKSMDSRVQVEQIIGRLLRQPGVQHYPAERLNTAHFYVRVDRNSVFDELITAVGKKLDSEAPAVRLIAKSPGKATPEEIAPIASRSVPGTGYDTSTAVAPIQSLIDQFTDYRSDQTNTTGTGARRVVTTRVGAQPSEAQAGKWETYKRSTMVSARWLFTREVRRLFQNALGVAPTSGPKFDALVGVGSPAHSHISTLAREIVGVYTDNVYLKQRKPDPYVVGPILARRDSMEPFKNALHEGYDGLNGLELRFAKALDDLGHPWCRNLPRTGYGIPLVTPGTTNTFFPDFLVWLDQPELVIAIDTTGGHVLPEKAARKLLAIQPANGVRQRTVIRFVSEGRWDASLTRLDTSGYTVWEQSPTGERRALFHPQLESAVDRALHIPS